MKAVPRSGALWAGAFVAAAGVVVTVGALNIRDPGALSDPLGPRAFPLALGAALVLLGAALAVRAVLHRDVSAADTGRIPPVAVVTGGIVAYLLVLDPLGYLIATFLFLSGLFRYLGERRWWAAAVVAAGATALLFVAFRDGLGVALPSGVLSLAALPSRAPAL